MQNNNLDGGRAQTDLSAATRGAKERIEREAQSAREALHDARDGVARKAGEYATQAKEAVTDQAEDAQQDIGASLEAFGGALRAAADHLANSDQQAASQFMSQAAGGLENFAGSLKNKPFAEVLGDLRSFGRENSGALMAGSMLAGLALGRFVKSGTPAPEPSDPNEQQWNLNASSVDSARFRQDETWPSSVEGQSTFGSERS